MASLPETQQGIKRGPIIALVGTLLAMSALSRESCC
jgi:hypothetical protein